ncbi:hypothetical protein ACVV7K_004292 [Cronobacter sakazakii]
MSVKDDAYEWGYNAAAGKAAYENEIFTKFVLVGIAIIVVAVLFGYIAVKIDEYKEKKREEEYRIARAKRKKKREGSNGR